MLLTEHIKLPLTFSRIKEQIHSPCMLKLHVKLIVLIYYTDHLVFLPSVLSLSHWKSQQLDQDNIVHHMLLLNY